MNDDEFRKMAEEHDEEANRRLGFCGVLIIAGVVTFVVCSIVFVVRMLMGY